MDFAVMSNVIAVTILEPKTVPVSGCQRCPQGKYSLGGGQLFSQRTNAWSSSLSAELQTDCMTQNMFTGRWQHNCNPWESSADGSYISSGENSRVMENFEGVRLYSTLRVSAIFVRNGSVTYKYRVDAEKPYDGLMFQVDDDQSSGLVSQSDGWVEAVVQVSGGAHTLAWNYVKDYTGDAGADKAYIKVIELVGTAWSDLHCHTCGGDMTNRGGSLCAFCGPNDASNSNDNTNDGGDSEDHSIVHLLHGGENGTFNQVVHINVTTASVKEFVFVVRAASVQAKRTIEVKVVSLGFTGTQEGAGVSCDTCPSGYEPTNPNDDQQTYGCRVCPAGTFAESGDSTGIVACAECPANTYSKEGAAKCIPCGVNTYSSSGAVTCAAPQVLTLNASLSSEEAMSSSSSPSAAVSSALDGLQVTYNLSQLETLVWGNGSWMLDDTVYGNSTSLQATKPVESSVAFRADGENYWFTGLFRPLGSSWLEQVPGQVVDQDVDTDSDIAYVVFASMMNPREAGNFFQQSNGVYGEVMCSAPAQWKLVNGGSHMDILPLESGAGVKVSLTNGSPCVNGKTMSTTFNFECDLSSGTTSKPAFATQDDDRCNWNIIWKTAYACPICDRDYFNELRSACNGGEQLVSYARKLACHGGSDSESTDAITACTESAVVLDTKALYSVYAAVVVVGFVVLLLLMAILIIHRKYRDAYNDYMYLKGKMPTEEKTNDDGSNETTFEFTPRSNALHSSPLGDPSSSPARSDQRERNSDVVDASAVVDNELHSVQSV